MSKVMDVTKAINWNKLDDPMDFTVLKRAEDNFWLPEKIPISNDVAKWRTLPESIKQTMINVLAGLTLLDTIQYTDGLPAISDEALTQHEVAVLSQFEYMEAVHARSYSSIFATVCTTMENETAFAWSATEPTLVRKAEMILEAYRGADKYERKINSCFLEGFWFYSGFYFPFYMDSRGLPNIANVIKLIHRDEAIHLYYMGYKYQQMIKDLPQEEKDRLQDYTYERLSEFYEVEADYARMLYDEHGLTERVLAFMRYNGNRALRNLGYEPLFPDEICQVDAEILLAMSGDGNHDFFSLAGRKYLLLDRESSTNEDRGLLQGII